MTKAVSSKALSVMVALLFGLLIMWAAYFFGYLLFGQVFTTKPAYAATTLTVNSTADPGTGGCDATECTLREAITAANATTAADTIKFNIPGSGLHTISPNSNLPNITNPVTIDGYSQPEASPNTLAVGDNAVLKIQLSGANSDNGYKTGLEISAADSTVKGLVINRWYFPIYIVSGGGSSSSGSSGASGGTSGGTSGQSSSSGTSGQSSSSGSSGDSSGGGVTATGNKIEGNFIGTDDAGTSSTGLGNNYGVLINGAPDNTVGGTKPAARNITSGSTTSFGVEIDGSGSTGNQVQGNYIGTDKNGTADLGNAYGGVGISYNAQFNTIGGTTAGARNIISGNDRYGIDISGTSSTGGNKVQGNYIGTDKTGTAELGNTLDGVYIDGSVSNNTDNIIGGRASRRSKPGNVISGNNARGVQIYGAGATGNQVQGNYIGTKANGTEALGNSNEGVFINVASDNTIGGATAGERNIISGGASYGVVMYGGDGRNQLLGNYIGTDKTGALDLGNAATGVYINGSPDNTVGGTTAGARNLISGNGTFGSGGNGVVIYTSAATRNKLQGNYIGTDVTGKKDLGNSGTGVYIVDAPDNTVGGTEAGARNVISGNGSLSGDSGVNIYGSGATGTEVQGNYIGTDASGTKALGNMWYGVYIQSGASNNTIGGATTGARNVISGNFDYGVVIFGSAGDTKFNKVQGNYIGTDRTGTLDLGNGSNGVRINGSPNNTIGGTTAGARNIISGNDGLGAITIGFDSSTTGNKVQGNYIGTDVTGIKPLGNASGVLISEAPNNTVGGTEAGAPNIISYNKGAGVVISNDTGGATGNSILSNSIFSNEDASSPSSPELGIDLTPNYGVTANNNSDSWQNFPEDLSATSSSASTFIEGKVTGNASGTQLTIQFFSSPAADPSGNGEGKTFLGETTASADSSGVATFGFSTSTKIPAGAVVTATATDPDGNTSEFSEALRVP